MAGNSIYDVEYSQQMGMPSDTLTENDYTQDVFLQTRPEVFDFDERDKGDGPHEGDPYFKNYDIDESVKYQENSLDRYNQKPQDWDKQRNILINPYQRSDRKGSVQRVIDAHLIEAATPPKKNEPKNKKKDIKPTQPTKPVKLSGRTPTLAKLMHYTSKFSKNRSPNTTVSIKHSDPQNMIWTYTATGKEPWSKKGGHTVTVKLEKADGMKDFREMKVNVTCDCEFWKFWGPDFNSGQGAGGLEPYRLGPSKIDPGVSPTPKIRDPGRHNLICKHVAAVGRIFQKYAAKNNLDTYKQVEGIFDQLEEVESKDPEQEIEGVKAVVDKMERSDQRVLKPLISRYEREENEYRKESMRKNIMMSFEDTIETKEKSWLQKILDFLYKFFKIKKSSKNASAYKVIEMYLKEY